jgi:hypothetical protein
VAGAKGTLVLIVGGHEPARAIGSALKRAGVGVRLWAGPSTQAAAHAAGLEADSGRMLVDSLNREAELEEVTDAVLLSRSDDFNALAATELRGDLGHGHVYRIAPDRDGPDLLPPATEANILGGDDLTLAELTQRLGQGERFVLAHVDSAATAEDTQDGTTLFVVDPNGGMRAATDGNHPVLRSGDTTIKLVAPAPNPS